MVWYCKRRYETTEEGVNRYKLDPKSVAALDDARQGNAMQCNAEPLQVVQVRGWLSGLCEGWQIERAPRKT